MTFRKTLFWLHLCTGVTAASVVLIMSVTGVLLMYQKQITAWADRAYRVAMPASGTTRLSLETLLFKARQSQSATPETVTWRADSTAPVALGFGRETVLYFNPYTGEMLGAGTKGIRAFFRVVTGWHRWLGTDGGTRAIARAVTGACNLGFLFLVVSGFFIWWPKQWTWPQLRNVTWFRRGLPAKARDFNWHNAIGFWSAIPLFVVVLSATVISYPWASNLVYRLVGEEPPGQNPPSPRRSGVLQSRQVAGAGGLKWAEMDGQTAEPSSDLNLNSIDSLWIWADQSLPGWQSLSVRVPRSMSAPLVFTIDQGNGGQPQMRAQLTLDRTTGAVLQWEPFSSLTAGRRVRTILRFAHTGEVAGIVGQTIAGIVSAGAAVLVYTGLALTWRRFSAWRVRRFSQQAVDGCEPRKLPDLRGSSLAPPYHGDRREEET